MRPSLYKLLLPAALLAPATAHAFPTEDDQTAGEMAINFRRQSNVWSRLDVGVVDAQVKSNPPDATKFDRRLEALAIAGGEADINKRWGLRLNMKAETSKRKEAEQEAPRAIVEKTITTISPSLDGTFVTDKGLEFFVGLAGEQTRPYTESVSSSSASSSTHFDKSTLIARRVGVVRRTAPWTGGFYYTLGTEGERGYHQTGSDGSELRGTDTVFIPSRMGVFGEFAAVSAIWNVELDFVQARGLGPKDPNGNTIYTDYFEARAGAFIPFGGPLGLKLAGAYKTLSYASNAYVSLETMPVGSLKALLVFGNQSANFFLGAIGAYGKDGQSLPELNAQYKLTAFSATSGFFFPL
jgi:hypothetical protein